MNRMSGTKNFKSYNFVTGAVDGTLAYDFSRPAYYPEEVYEAPKRQPVKTKEPVWVKEELKEKAQAVVRSRQGISLLALIGSLAVIVVLVMTLLAHIRLVGISQQSVELESQIAELKTEHTRLTVEYETIFNLKDVEEYAVSVLGMQEPRDDQIYYLSNVSSADKAVIVSQDGTDILSAGVQDLVDSFYSYFH